MGGMPPWVPPQSDLAGGTPMEGYPTLGTPTPIGSRQGYPQQGVPPIGPGQGVPQRGGVPHLVQDNRWST